MHTLILPWKRKGKKRKKKVITDTGYSYLVTHPSTNPTKQRLTLLSERCCPCGIVTLCWTHFLKFLTWEKVSTREKKLWHCMAGKEENKRLKEYENENYYLLWWSDKWHFLIIASVSRTKISRSHRSITLWMWMFSTVLHLLVYSLTVAGCTIS